MQITYKSREEATPFEKIKVGECFRFNSDFFIKAKYNTTIHAVHLKDGIGIDLSPKAPCTLLTSHLLVRDKQEEE